MESSVPSMSFPAASSLELGPLPSFQSSLAPTVEEQEDPSENGAADVNPPVASTELAPPVERPESVCVSSPLVQEVSVPTAATPTSAPIGTPKAPKVKTKKSDHPKCCVVL